MTSANGKQICLTGWKVAGIKEAVAKGLSGSVSLGPFDDNFDILTINESGLSSALRYISEYEREDESDEEG